jgi:hypothetical protein
MVKEAYCRGLFLGTSLVTALWEIVLSNGLASVWDYVRFIFKIWKIQPIKILCQHFGFWRCYDITELLN